MMNEPISGESMKNINVLPIKVKKPEPWMKYVTLLESAFRACDGNSNQMKKIMDGVEDVLSKVPLLKHTLTESPEYVATDSYHPDIMLPKAEDVKASGRPRKARRFTSLKKDFSKAKFRALYALYGKRVKAKYIYIYIYIKKSKKRKIDDVEEEENKDLIEETSSRSRAFLKSDCVYDAKFLFEKKKKRRIDVEVLLLIKKDAVLYTFSPEGDGWCGYRAIAEMMEKNENMFPRVKEKMLHAFEKYKNIYRENFWFQDLGRSKKNIGNGVDWTAATLCSKCSGDRFFYTPECAQVVPNAYCVPVCMYSNNSNMEAVTYLLIDYTTDKMKQRSPKPLILQVEHNIH
ncbi:hypothetical protein RMATCC62417_14554 [Rhizopus microsporus]|nr:hypothetical protein RMATCC62417_14554 [Rhizopus microsporus]